MTRPKAFGEPDDDSGPTKPTARLDKFGIGCASHGGGSEYHSWAFSCDRTRERYVLHLNGPSMTRAYVIATLRDFADKLERAK